MQAEQLAKVSIFASTFTSTHAQMQVQIHRKFQVQVQVRTRVNRGASASTSARSITTSDNSACEHTCKFVQVQVQVLRQDAVLGAATVVIVISAIASTSASARDAADVAVDDDDFAAVIDVTAAGNADGNEDDCDCVMYCFNILVTSIWNHCSRDLVR